MKPTRGRLDGIDWRTARASDPPCSCGRRARIVYITEMFGDVPGCGEPDVPPLADRFDDPEWVARWAS